jgi:hypothetical protein
MFRTALIAVALLLTSLACGESQASGERVKVNGMQMYYEVSGSGEPLVVLHGAYMNIETMGTIIPKLAKSHKVYALEFQGHGRTTDIDRPITYMNLATMWPPSWTPSSFRRQTFSGTRWAPGPGCSSPSVIRPR